MKPALQGKLDNLDLKLAELLKSLQKYSDEDLNWKPSPNQWSVMQVMEHLMAAEGFSIKYIQKKLSFNPQLKKAGILAGMRRSAVWLTMKVPIKVKAPEAVNEQLPDHSSFWDVAKQWKQQRVEMQDYLKSLSEDVLKREIFKHPSLGRMGVKGMFTFFDTHFDRHLKQINRILKNYRY